jgi:hypothetical protein
VYGTAEAAVARWGIALAYADDSGVGGPVPIIHAGAWGAPTRVLGTSVTFATNAAAAQGLEFLVWTGGPFDLDPAWFEGTLDYNTALGGGSFTYVNAGVALIDASAFGSTANLGDQYSKWGLGVNGAGNVFAADCGTPGALGFANTGPHTGFGLGPVSLTESMTSCGPVHVDTGDALGFWSKLVVFSAGNGFVDATHTFSIDFAPGVDPAIEELIASSVAPVIIDPGVTAAGLPGGFRPSGTPEPGAWALFILGLGALGAMFRRKHRISPVPAL